MFNPLMEEFRLGRQEIRKQFGWHLLIKDVADFCNCECNTVLKMPAIEVFGWVKIIQAKIEIMKEHATIT